MITNVILVDTLCDTSHYTLPFRRLPCDPSKKRVNFSLGFLFMEKEVDDLQQYVPTLRTFPTLEEFLTLLLLSHLPTTTSSDQDYCVNSET